MRRIDTNEIMDAELFLSQNYNRHQWRKGLRPAQSVVWGKLKTDVLSNFYSNKARLYELSRVIIEHLANNECRQLYLIEKSKWARGTEDRDIHKLYMHLLEHNIYGKELTDKEEEDKGIYFPINENNEEIENSNMTDDEIYLKNIKIMFDQGIAYLADDYPMYDYDKNNVSDSLEQLYQSKYYDLTENFAKMAVQLNELTKLQNLIDMNNIIHKHEENDDKNNDINNTDDDED